MGWLYTVVWFAIAVYLFVMALRENRFLFVLSGFMVFLGVWELINTLTEVDMKSGTYGWIYRGVAAVVLVGCLIWYYWRRNKG